MKIKLNLKDKLKYYKVTIIFMIIGLWCITSEIENFNLKLYEFGTLGKIGIAIIIISIINLLFLEKNLYYRKFQFNIENREFRNRLVELTEKNNWKIIEINSNDYILRTHRFDKYERNDFLKKNYSERIYIKICNQIIYFKSINDFDSDFAIRISTGENQLNEKLIKKAVMPAANNG